MSKIGRPRVNGKKKVGLSLSKRLFDRLRKRALREGSSISGAVEQAIEAWLSAKSEK